MSNHLGNVLVTVSDKKLQHTTNGTTVDYYNADVVTASDYYPFGMQMPGRKYSQPNINYRYGFNGKENDNEVKGEGNQQDYGMRISDPRLGRFLSIDPITQEYPELTPYQFASNRPIDGIDLDGLEYSPAGRSGREKNYIATDATAVVHYSANPLILQKQVEERPRILMAEVQKRANTQAPAVIKQNRRPDAIQQAKNDNLKEAQEARTIPDNHWTKNKHLNNFSENIVDPIFAGATLVDGVGGVKLLLQSIGKRAITEAAGGGAAALARSWQASSETYTGIDVWRSINLKEGTFIAGGMPGQSNFYTTLSGMNRSELLQVKLFEGLQVAPGQQGWRGGVGIFKVNENTSAAFGTTYANPSLGAGGLPQIFVPDKSKLELITILPLKK